LLQFEANKHEEAFMKRIALLSLIVVGLALLVSPAGLAQQKPKMPPDFSFEVKEKSPGKVTFSHEKHYEQFPKCTECHTKIFKMKRGTTEGPFTMARMEKGELCGACHNGEKKGAKGQVIFSVREKNDCARCHVKG
jgi:c(7)-type cytochrome triheme protein